MDVDFADPPVGNEARGEGVAPPRRILQHGSICGQIH
jgi:hypothetical protein